MSINCQSLNAKYDYIKLLLNVFTQHEQPIQVVCLQETWIEDASLLDLSLFQIHDYNLVTQDRYASAHGGLALYMHKNWSYTVKPCENKSLYWEEMFVTLADPLASNPTKICIGNFYRPPHTQVTQLMLFIDYFNTTIAQFEARNETSYVCGDYNINLLLINENIYCSSFFECILGSGY